MLDLARYPLQKLADQVGTPFYLYDAAVLRETLGRLMRLVEGEGLACRYAMKANSTRKVLETVRDAGLWIDAVSGNEVLRALRAGFSGGVEPPVIMLTTDVFRDNALAVVQAHAVLPNVGSPGMVRELRDAGYRGPLAVRVNPGFGHGHVESCDTGGPSSKHGIWPDDLADVRREAMDARLAVLALHAHVGTGPGLREFDANMRRLVDFFVELLPGYPDVAAVNFGGGIPHPYRPDEPAYDLGWYRPVLDEARKRLSDAAGRQVRVEIEPGRYPVAGCAVLVARVKDVKRTRTNPKGPGHTFVMVDAGFNDLLRPAMYGAYHHIEVVRRTTDELVRRTTDAGVRRATDAVGGGGADRPSEACVVAGPLCESGDVFTRDDRELVVPRSLPRPEPGDLLVLQDAGAYGAVMSSNYVSMGRVPQVLWDGGRATLMSRRETVDDIVRTECDEPL